VSDKPAFAADLESALGSSLLSAREEGDGFVFRVAPDAVHGALEKLRDAGFNLLVDLTAVDWSASAEPTGLAIVGEGSVGGASFVPPGKVGSPAPEATSATSVQTKELHGRGTRFEFVYRLMSLNAETGLVTARASVKARLAEGEPAPRSVMDLYPCADWFEREVWDMFGVPFADRPGIKRLLMYEEFVGHPLRKDYPINKRQPLIGPPSGEPARNPSFNHLFPTVTPDDE